MTAAPAQTHLELPLAHDDLSHGIMVSVNNCILSPNSHVFLLSPRQCLRACQMEAIEFKTALHGGELILAGSGSICLVEASVCVRQQAAGCGASKVALFWCGGKRNPIKF